ncbi:hypothetical protein HNP46_000332 [Pseudomonas nitritireducens]|uniref:Uncharacterized protein n=1 Tax=Pseudomonas nitroreducens TaxID=46680 RepID=A0A7W7KET3_PSENT|nr:hypothetical protein [Pseudomonas nitritireducens]MBB4861521.1 hypothetical protein [Pseudomonas nitritireducens]
MSTPEQLLKGFIAEIAGQTIDPKGRAKLPRMLALLAGQKRRLDRMLVSSTWKNRWFVVDSSGRPAWATPLTPGHQLMHAHMHSFTERMAGDQWSIAEKKQAKIISYQREIDAVGGHPRLKPIKAVDYFQRRRDRLQVTIDLFTADQGRDEDDQRSSTAA